MTDKTFILSRFKASIGFFNLYNQVRIGFVQPSVKDAIEPVFRPHFTFHPVNFFHLTDSKNGSKVQPTELFRGMNEVAKTVELHGKLPWIRAISPILSSLKAKPLTLDSILSCDWSIQIPCDNVSAKIEIDFVSPTETSGNPQPGEWHQIWKDVAIRCRMKFTYPSIPTLGWFHSY